MSQDGCGRTSDRADHGAAAHELSACQRHSLRCGRSHAGIEQNLDARPFHLPARKLSQLLADLGKNLVARMDECDREVFGAEILKVAGAASDQVINLTSSLDPAVAGADRSEEHTSELQSR